MTAAVRSCWALFLGIAPMMSPQGPVTLGDRPQRVLLRVGVEVGRDPPEMVTVYATTQFRRYGAKP